MKKLFLIIPVLAMLMATACEQISIPGVDDNTDVDFTDGVDQIASIVKQIEAMQASIKLLEQADKDILASIEKLQNSGTGAEDVAELQKQQEALAEEIREIESTLNGLKDWTSDNFATSGQLESLSETIEGLSAAVDSLQKQIEALGGTSGGFVSLIQSLHILNPGQSISLRKSCPYSNSETHKLYYSVYPKSFAKQLAENYQNCLSLQFTEFRSENIEADFYFTENSIYVPTRICNLPLSSCTADEQNGILTVEIAAKDIPEEFYFNSEMNIASYTMMLCVSDGTNQIQSNMIDVYPGYSSFKGDNYEEGVAQEAKTWKLNKEQYGIEEKIFAVGVSEDGYVNADKWLSAELDEASGDINLSIKENLGEDRRTELKIICESSIIWIVYTQYGKPWTLEADKTEVMFTEDGGEAIVTVKCNRNAEISIENYPEWIYVEHPWQYDGNAEIKMTVEPSHRRYSFSSSREALITVRDNRGTTLEINVSQSMPAPEGITASPEELTIPWEGGKFDIQLQHSAGGRITGIDNYTAKDINILYSEPQSLTDELTLLKLDFGPNDWPTARSGYIIVYYDSPEYGRMEIIYNIRQEARPLE